MRLTFKLTVGILIGLALQLALNVHLRVRREAAALEGEVRKDHLVLGRALSVDLVEELRDRGPDAFGALAERMNAERELVEIDVQPASALPEDVRLALENGAPLQRVRSVAGGDERLVTWLPIMARGELFAALTLDESLAPARAYVRMTLLRTAVWTLTGLSATAVCAWLFGFLLIGRPVRSLVDKARRVGQGDLSGPLSITRNDELGLLASEINAMCERLAAARADLERATEQRIDALKQLRHADRLSTLGLLSAGLAHELGTPLNIVAGRARLIADRENLDPGVVRDAVLIEQQAQRVERIVRQLLDFARARRPEKMDTDVTRVVTETVELLRSLAQKRGVELVVDGTAAAQARIDAAQIQQALTNLIVNAVHASDRGDQVRLVVKEDEREVTVAVEDDGSGMDEEALAKLFTPFFTTKDVGEGTGLGLAVAWGLVEENGGTIKVRSEKGQGSVFTIHFPKEVGAA